MNNSKVCYEGTSIETAASLAARLRDLDVPHDGIKEALRLGAHKRAEAREQVTKKAMAVAFNSAACNCCNDLDYTKIIDWLEFKGVGGHANTGNEGKKWRILNGDDGKQLPYGWIEITPMSEREPIPFKYEFSTNSEGVELLSVSAQVSGKWHRVIWMIGKEKVENMPSDHEAEILPWIISQAMRDMKEELEKTFEEPDLEVVANIAKAVAHMKATEEFIKTNWSREDSEE